MIIWGQKSNDETRVKNPQSCDWVVVWQNQFEPTRRHFTQRKLHTWRVGPSPSFVEHHHLLDVSLQPLPSLKQKAECHVKESSRKYFQRRFDSGKTETNEFGVKKLRECEDPLQDSCDFHSPGNPELNQSCVSSRGRQLTRNLNQNPTKFSQKKRRHKMILNLPPPGNWSGEMSLRTQPAPRNWSEVKTFKSEGQNWSSTTCQSPIIDTSRKSSKNSKKTWISQKMHPW